MVAAAGAQLDGGLNGRRPARTAGVARGRADDMEKEQRGRRRGAAAVTGGKRRCRSGSAVNPSSTLPAVKHMLQVPTLDQSKGALVRSSSPKSYLPLCVFH